MLTLFSIAYCVWPAFTSLTITFLAALAPVVILIRSAATPRRSLK
jgi:hypothetical protein